MNMDTMTASQMVVYQCILHFIQENGERFSRHGTSVALKKGYHPIKIIYLSNICKGWLTPRLEVVIRYRAKDEKTFKNVSDEMLVH